MAFNPPREPDSSSQPLRAQTKRPVGTGDFRDSSLLIGRNQAAQTGHLSSETQEAQHAGFNQQACSVVIGAPRARIWSYLGFQMPGVLVSTGRVSAAHVAACKCRRSRRQPHSFPGVQAFL